MEKMLDKLRTRWKIGNIVLTNTLLHLVVGAICGLSGLLMRFIPELRIFTAIAFVIVTVVWEVNQKSSNKIDSIVDIIAGNIGFNAVFWLLIYI